MPTFTVTGPDGKVRKVNAPEGSTKEDAIAYVADTFYAKPEAVEMPQPVDVGGRIKRNAGLQARSLMEGAPGLVDFATLPFRTLYAKGKQAITGDGSLPPGLSDYMGYGADALGLPQAENAPERVSTGMTKLIAGGAPSLALPKLSPALTAFGEKPVQQLASMVGAGGAGETAKELGAPPSVQFAASLAGGMGLPLSIKAGQNLINNIPRLNAMSDSAIQAMLNRSGIDLTNMTIAAKNQLIDDIKTANVDPSKLDITAIKRLADFYRVNATPTKGMVTQNPVQITRERNAAAAQANQAGAELEGLPKIYNDNDKAFINNLDRLGADKAVNREMVGGSVYDDILKQDISRENAVNNAYDAFRNSGGRDVQFDAKAFYDDVIDKLVKDGSVDELPQPIKNRIQSYVDGYVNVDGKKYPLSFNVDEIKTLDKMLGRAMQNRETSHAAKLVRESLYKVYPKMPDAQPGTSPVPYNPSLASVQGTNARNLYEQARDTAASRFKWQDSTPAIKAMLNSAAPEKFLDEFVLGSTNKASIGNVEKLVKTLDSNSVQQIRLGIINHLKRKSIGTSVNDAGKFRTDSFTNELDRIGDGKLKLFFDEGELAQLRALSRASKYAVVQPSGSAVNNSNSGVYMATKVLDWLGSKMKGVPVVQPMVGDPLRELSGKMRYWGLGENNIPASIRANAPKSGSLVAPPVIYGGLLLSE